MPLPKSRMDYVLVFTLLALLIATAGCLHARAPGNGGMRQSITVNGTERSFIVHLPASYDAAGPALPLVIVLHGGGGNAESMMRMTGMNGKADRENFIIVYPDGTGLSPGIFLTWNGGFCCGEALERGSDDVSFIQALIADLREQYRIDPSRIYVTGISNGGIMAYRLGAELSETIAAIAPVAGSAGGMAGAESPLWTPVRPEVPVSVAILHGTADDRVPYDGGLPKAANTRGAYQYLSVNQSADLWTGYNGCVQAGPELSGDTGLFTAATFDSCRNGTEVIIFTIRGRGHTWFGGGRWAPWGDDPGNAVSANDIIWEFFKTHPKQTAYV